MSSTPSCAPAATAFASARSRPDVAVVGGAWHAGGDESGSFHPGISPIAPTTAPVNAAAAMQRLTPGDLGGLT